MRTDMEAPIVGSPQTWGKFLTCLPLDKLKTCPTNGQVKNLSHMILRQRRFGETDAFHQWLKRRQIWLNDRHRVQCFRDSILCFEAVARDANDDLLIARNAALFD